MQDQRLPEPRFDQRRPDQSRRFKHESFTDRIETGAQFKPETENIPSLLSIVHSRDPKQAQRLVELYLNNRDLGVTALPEAERDAICLKIRSIFNTYDFSPHLRKGFSNVHVKLTDYEGATDPLSLEKVAAIFKVDFDLTWNSINAVLKGHTPQSERKIKFDLASPTNDKGLQILSAVGENWIKFADDINLDSKCLFGAAIRHCYRSITRDLLRGALIQDLQKECGFEFSESLQTQLAQSFKTKDPYSILTSRQLRNLIEIAHYCEQESKKPQDFNRLASKYLNASNWRTSAGLATTDLIQAPQVREQGVTQTSSPTLTMIGSIIEEKFDAQILASNREWSKLPVWLLNVSGGNVALVQSVLNTIDSKETNPKLIVSEVRSRKKEIELALKIPEVAITQKPAVLERPVVEREIVFAANSKGKVYFSEFMESLDPSTAIVLKRALVKLQRFEGRYPLMRSATNNNVYEVRIFTGPGYRIYFGIEQGKIIILKAGTKDTQQADIVAADGVFSAYKNRQD